MTVTYRALPWRGPTSLGVAARVGLALALTIVGGGCAPSRPLAASEPQRTTTGDVRSPTATFSKSLNVCRFWKGGHPNRRRSVPATDPYIAACLARKGWTPDGLPLDLLEPPRTPPGGGAAMSNPSTIDPGRRSE